MSYGDRAYGSVAFADSTYPQAAPTANEVTQNAEYQIDENIGLALTQVTDADYQVDENITVYIPTSSGGKFLRIVRRGM